jgi:hypothetical protein
LQSDDAVKNSNRKPSTRRAFVIHSLFGWIRIPSFHFTNAAECGRIELRKRQNSAGWQLVREKRENGRENARAA